MLDLVGGQVGFRSGDFELFTFPIKILFGYISAFISRKGLLGQDSRVISAVLAYRSLNRLQNLRATAIL